PAALCMSMIKYSMDSLPEETMCPSSILEALNRVIGRNIDDDMFITMFYAQYHCEESILTYSSAGHEPDRKSTRLNSSHVSISYLYSPSLHDALPILPAALCMSMIKYSMDSLPEETMCPSSILEALNRVIGRNIDDDMFITMFYAQYHCEESILTYSSAGHE